MKMMLSKPISSPGRTDKFPTPLMTRFLRSNVGSRSRGRSRSSPMFITPPKKNAASVMNDTIQQEPSSPKVTCIGQVRSRRASKAANKSTKTGRNNPSTSTKQSPCVSWLPWPSPCSSSNSFACCFCRPKGTVPFCCHFNPKFPKPRSPSSSCGASIRKWVLFFRFGYCKKVDDDARDDSIHVVESIHRCQNHVTSSSISDAVDLQGNEITVQETMKEFIESSCPPKNALLLTRCRSAPYRSSSLAGRFWRPETETETETAKNESQGLPAEGEKPISCSPNFGNEAAAVESRNNSSLDDGSSEEELLGSCSNERSKEEVIIHRQDLRVGSFHPLLLTRCKSEPARTGERLLIPEVNFWMQRRSDTSESCLQ